MCFDVWHRSRENSIKITVERREQGRELCQLAFHESFVKCVAFPCEPKEIEMNIQNIDEIAVAIYLCCVCNERALAKTFNATGHTPAKL